MQRLLIALFFTTAIASSGTTLNFEDQASGECAATATNFSAQGYTFTKTSGITCVNTATPTGNSNRFASNGTQTLGVIDYKPFRANSHSKGELE